MNAETELPNYISLDAYVRAESLDRDSFDPDAWSAVLSYRGVRDQLDEMCAGYRQINFARITRRSKTDPSLVLRVFGNAIRKDFDVDDMRKLRDDWSSAFWDQIEECLAQANEIFVAFWDSGD